MAVTESSSTTGATDNSNVINVLNPSTGEVIGSVPIHSEAEVNASVSRARQAAQDWQALPMPARKSELDQWRHALAARADDLADLIHRENGKPRVDAIVEVAMALNHLQHATNRAAKALAPHRVSPGILANFRARISYHPLGVIGVIGPWNYPIFTPMGSIAYALAAGNAVVFKPSELTPLIGRLLADIAARTMSVPNLVQVVTGGGTTGAALARSAVDKVAFTGSSATGRKVMAAASENLTPVLMELGGKDPLIVAGDADVDKAAEAALFGALSNAGQACISVERAYVANSVYDQFVSRVVDGAKRIRIGGEDADIGAMTRSEQIDIIREHISDALDKGARAVVGGVDTVDGNFVRPTVLVDVTADMKIMQEETFGPVLPIIEVQDAEEGVRQANQTDFGLGSSIFGTERVRELADRIRAGMTSINSVLAYSAIPSLPFGGVGESGFGRIHGDEGLREFTRTKSTVEQRFASPIDLLSFNLPANTYDRVRSLIKRLYGGGVVDRASSMISKLF
ncbi:MAG: aldehyde dehydrogenase family protein [Proteobacteria bacterium]|nr:aldehyde dehydrogenase family protein [Pseudomonadota bacterium]